MEIAGQGGSRWEMGVFIAERNPGGIGMLQSLRGMFFGGGGSLGVLGTGVWRWGVVVVDVWGNGGRG